MAKNGLTSYSLHAADADRSGEFAALYAETAEAGFGLDGGAPSAVDPETAARQHLAMALASQSTSLAQPLVEGLSADFRLLGTETIELTGTKTVKFRQAYNKIPVYGSLVTVELDENNDLLAINTSLAEPEGVSPVASIAPATALDVVRQAGGAPDPNTIGRFIYYFDTHAEPDLWRLCYLFEDIPLTEEGVRQMEGESPDDERLPPPLADFIIDAHSGELAARVPRAADAAQPPAGQSITARDEMGRERTIRVVPRGDIHEFHDDTLNVHTYDVKFADVGSGRFVASYCMLPPDAQGAVSAHANAAAVAEFLRTILKRQGLDGKNGELRSHVNCTLNSPGTGEREWRNAMWSGGQMFYGQRRGAEGRLVSIAIDIDVVAHEFIHGLTEYTAKMQYMAEPGALNESYSDIFGVIIANFDRTDRSQWDFRIGPNFRGNGEPLRSLQQPSSGGQPEHMDQYQKLPLTRAGDWGGVHINSGIHNKAAYGMMAATSADGQPLFSAAELAQIFYLALTQHLSRTSGFSQSRRGVELAALTLFRNRPAELPARIQAIRRAYDAVGIA